MQEYIQTKDLSISEWKKKRNSLGIGGSDVAAVLGVSKWKTAVDVYLEKLGKKQDDEETDAMYFGKVLEPVIAERFMKETGLKVINDNKIRIHKKHPCLIANIDRLILKSGNETETGILEIKTTNGFYAKTWETEIPLEYYLQLQHYLNVTGYNYGYVAVLIDGRKFLYYRFERDEKLIKTMTEELVYFWNERVLKEVPPSPQDTEDVNKLFPKSQPVQKEAEKGIIPLINRIKDLKAQKKAIEGEMKILESHVKEFMGEAEELTYEGKPIATWKTVLSTRLDSRKLKKEKPELYAEYSTVSESRRFTIK